MGKETLNATSVSPRTLQQDEEALTIVRQMNDLKQKKKQEQKQDIYLEKIV